MGSNDLPDEVQRLLREHIHSLEQLDVLLLLRAREETAFEARTVNAVLQTSETSAAARLRDLEQRGFLRGSPDGAPTEYQYAPRDERLRQAVDKLAKSYAERRYSVIEAIFSKPIDNLRVYAGAFRFRKDDSDG